MVYRFVLKKSPRLVLLPAVSVLLIAGSLVLLVLVSPGLGFVALAVSGYLSWLLLRMFRNYMKSYVSIHDEGVSGKTVLGHNLSISWDGLDLTGRYSYSGEPTILFLYNETADTLIKIPPVYEGFDSMMDELKDRSSGFEDLEGNHSDDLEMELRKRFADEVVEE